MTDHKVKSEHGRGICSRCGGDYALTRFRVVRNHYDSQKPTQWCSGGGLYPVIADDVEQLIHAARAEGEQRGYELAIEMLKDGDRRAAWLTEEHVNDPCVIDYADYLTAQAPGATA